MKLAESGSLTSEHIYKATVIMTEEQKYRSEVKQERKLRDKPTHMWMFIFNRGGKNIQ